MGKADGSLTASLLLSLTPFPSAKPTERRQEEEGRRGRGRDLPFSSPSERARGDGGGGEGTGEEEKGRGRRRRDGEEEKGRGRRRRERRREGRRGVGRKRDCGPHTQPRSHTASQQLAPAWSSRRANTYPQMWQQGCLLRTQPLLSPTPYSLASTTHVIPVPQTPWRLRSLPIAAKNEEEEQQRRRERRGGMVDGWCVGERA